MVEISSFTAEISTMGVEVFDFGDAFKDFGMTEFMKEVFFRKSLVPFPDADAKHIKFKTLTERVNTENAIDWTSKFVERTKEQYSFGSYAKVNSLLMRHDNEEDTFGNGYLYINNNNLKDNITLLQSKYFAPSGTLRAIRSVSGLFLQIKFWEREIKQEESGPPTIDYQPLENRFFLLREEWIEKSITIGNTTVTGYPKAAIHGTTMGDVVEEFYSDWDEIFDSLRIHDIDLKLNQFNVNGLVMDRPYWFEQEGAFYLLNRLIYETGKVARGEFLKIKK